MSEENVVIFDGDSQEMRFASEKARETFKYFWRELSWEYRRIIPGLELSLVKVPFKTTTKGDGIPPFEHMWISEIMFDGEYIAGILQNQPNWIEGVSEGDDVKVPLSEISDWMYVINGIAYGAYTVNVMRLSMGSSERKEHDAAWGIEFGDPKQIQITPYSSEKPKGFFSKIFGGGKEDSSNFPEHPMSSNMTPELNQMLKNQPNFATDKDEEGWTILHREALAGNLEPVKTLLKHGANPNEKNNEGKTPLDLAKKMKWEKVIEVLT